MIIDFRKTGLSYAAPIPKPGLDLESSVMPLKIHSI